MCSPEGFHYFLNHVKQRLVVILDHNIPNGLETNQRDMDLLQELYAVYDNGAVDTYRDTDIIVEVTQKTLFDNEK